MNLKSLINLQNSLYIMLQFVSTSDKLVSENYPYGYTLKTTKYDWVEFKKGKGFRHVSQTVNPKTGKLNAEKKSTYYDVMLLGRDENGHVKSTVCSFYGNEGINKDCVFIADNFGLFTPGQIKDIVSVLLGKLIVSIKAQVIYCNSNFDALKPLFDPAIEAAKGMLKTGENLFNKVSLPIQEIEALKQPDYNPFKVTSYGI